MSGAKPSSPSEPGETASVAGPRPQLSWVVTGVITAHDADAGPQPGAAAVSRARSVPARVVVPVGVNAKLLSWACPGWPVRFCTPKTSRAVLVYRGSATTATWRPSMASRWLAPCAVICTVYA